MSNYGWMENVQSFVGGLSGLDIQWADVGPMSLNPEMSVVKGKVGFAMTPGCKKTWDVRKNEWVEFSNVNYSPYAAFGGWQILVASNAKNKEAAIDLASYYGSPEVLKKASVTGGSGVNPARFSTVSDVSVWEDSGFSKNDAKNYLYMVEDVLTHPNAVFQMRLPGYTQYQDALELAISKALSGQMSSVDALNEAANAWNSITEKIGRSSQKKLYRSSIGLM